MNYPVSESTYRTCKMVGAVWHQDRMGTIPQYAIILVVVLKLTTSPATV